MPVARRPLHAPAFAPGGAAGTCSSRPASHSFGRTPKEDEITPHPKPDARSTIGPFVVEGELGGGGMGVVYRAAGPGGELAAVKVLHPWTATPEVRRRFERESLIRIDHPNVVRVLSAGVDAADGTPYLALELLDGESLEARLGRGPLTAQEVVDLGAQACRGLAAAHERGVVHRDLKPSNLFLCRDGTVKLLDFGIALVTTRDTRITSEGGVLGTPAYMSPEQVRGESAVDLRTDVWSLGAVLYEALAGRPPFVRETPLAVMLAILMAEPEPLWVCAPVAPKALGAAIERALAKPKELRWAHAQALADALAAVDVASSRARAQGGRARPDDSALGDTLAAPIPAVQAPSSLIPPGEHRIVAVLLAEGVRDVGAFRVAVEAHGGSLLPLVGHRAIGLFGAEAWEGDEVSRAALAALAARGAAERMAVASGRAMSAGVGISGDVLRAAEAGCAATLSGVAVDAASARSVEDELVVNEIVEKQIWEITARRPIASRQVRRAESDPPLLGRDAEVAQLRAGLRRAAEECHPVVLLVTGPPGVGKTRLRRAVEAQIEALPDPALALSARAEPLRREVALSLVGAALRSHPDLDPDLPEPARRAALLRLAAEAIEDGQAAKECAEFLGELLGVAMPDTPALLAARADPQLMMDRLRLAVLDLCEGLSVRGLLALLLEDVQWADRASLAFLDDLLDRLADAPLLLLATARPELVESAPSLFAGRDVVRVEPRGLISSDVATLAQWIAGRPLPEQLTRAVAERTAGHPLFVEQIVLALRDRDLLGTDAPELPTTPTVEAAVQSRLDHLPPAEKDACKRASVFGRPFTADELEAMGVAGAASLLGSLGRRDLVVGRARAGGRGRQFQFRSALVADVAYGMIADGARSELHRRAAAYLSMQSHSDDEEIASHHERGGESARAAERYAAAAIAAAPRGDSRTVLRCSDRALSLGAPPASLFPLHMARADALRFLGRRDDQGRELSVSREHAVSDADRARVLIDQAVWMSRAGQIAEAAATAEEAAVAAERAGEADLRVMAWATYAGALVYGGKAQQAREVLDRALAVLDAATPRARAIVVGWRAHLATALGDHGERRDAFEAAVALYGEAGDLRRVASAEVNLADVYNRLGAYAEAEAALRAALEGCRRVGNRIPEGYALLNLGYALSMQGKTEEALESLAGAAAIATGSCEIHLALWAGCYRARTRLSEADPAAVVREAESVAAEAERVGNVAVFVGALTVAALGRLATGDVEGALRASGQALSLLDERGGIEEGEAELFVTHAEVLDAAGRGAEAAEVRRRGQGRVREIADRILDPAWRSRFLSSVAANRDLMKG